MLRYYQNAAAGHRFLEKPGQVPKNEDSCDFRYFGSCTFPESFEWPFRQPTPPSNPTPSLLLRLFTVM